VRGRRASQSDTRAASQAFERMHNTMSHRVKTKVPGGTAAAAVSLCVLCQRAYQYQFIVYVFQAPVFVREHCPLQQMAERLVLPCKLHSQRRLKQRRPPSHLLLHPRRRHLVLISYAPHTPSAPAQTVRSHSMRPAQRS
jgi:hypothetical protein